MWALWGVYPTQLIGNHFHASHGMRVYPALENLAVRQQLVLRDRTAELPRHQMMDRPSWEKPSQTEKRWRLTLLWSSGRSQWF